MRRFKPSPAMVVALLALVFAMAGTGIAAKSYVVSSSKQIKDGAVTGADVKNSSLTGTDIKDKSLTATDFTGSVQGAVGPQGIQGSAGPQGIQGPNGAFGPVITRSVVGGPTPDTGQASATAVCHADEVAVGGGGFFSGGAGGASTIQASRPFHAIRDSGGNPTSTTDPVGTNTADEWGITATNNSGGSRNLVAYVLCVARPG